MLYNLKNGRTIELSVEEFLLLSDYELDRLEGLNLGDVIENPFFNSSIGNGELDIHDHAEVPLTLLPYEVKLADKELQALDM